MEDFRRYTCCFTGHRVIEPWEEQKILTRLRFHLEPLIRKGVRYFGVGGAQGFDMLAAEYLLDLRDRYKQKDIRRQEEIIRKSDKAVYVCQENEEGAFLARDRKLADESAYCICYCHRRSGGTAYTVRYALGKGIPVFNTSSWDVRQLTAEKGRRRPDTGWTV